MKLDLARAEMHYNAAVDVLEIELDPDVRRSSTIAYEDLLLVHLGRDRAGEIVPQGLTFIGYEALRARVLRATADEGGHTVEEARRALAQLELVLEEEGEVLVARDRRAWDAASFRIRSALTDRIDLVHDPLGAVVGIVVDGRNGFDEAAITRLLDLAFDTVLAPPEDDPAGGALPASDVKLRLAGEWTLRHWLVPLLACARAA